MSNESAIPVIDLFAGPGGLGEGFAAAGFDIRLSIEKDPAAHRTLELRAFFRQFDRAPDDYYEHLRGRLSREELFASHPRQAVAAMNEAMLAELGVMDHTIVRDRIKSALNGADPWVLIGGPPCQAYSLVGRARNRGIKGYSLGQDPKARLYIEYLRILADHWPAAFVMENVRGMLSAKIDGELVFDRICTDLVDPAAALKLKSTHKYALHALSGETSLFANAPADYLVRCERYGVPQARHRVIVVGLRNDVAATPGTLDRIPAPSVYNAIGDLPKLRSGLSKESDDAGSWLDAVLEIFTRDKGTLSVMAMRKQLSEIRNVQSKLRKLCRGGEFIPHNKVIGWREDWFHDSRLSGVVNHSTRSHIRGDLHRYLFAAVFAKVHGYSPKLAEFPVDLLPAHDNAKDNDPAFADRFRVQLRDKPSTTITSHISKDGHYYIHYDPRQCRSLTVREAARLQTFPDNYFFVGPRTDQYRQVGNAVPPLLAFEIAKVVSKTLN